MLDRLFACMLSGCLVALWLGFINPSVAMADEQWVQQAVDEYSAAMETTLRDERIARFSRAEQLFRQVVDSMQAAEKQPSTQLLVNLGNAALQAEHTGNAIAAFRQALLQDPNNHQAMQNLAYARSIVPDFVRRDTEQGLVETLFFWKRIYSSQQISLLAAVAFLVAAGMIAMGISSRNSIWRNLAVLPLCIWIILLTSLWIGGNNVRQEGVITADEALLYSADSENSAPRLAEPLPDGAEVRILQERENWTEIAFSGRSGWIRSTAITRILR